MAENNAYEYTFTNLTPGTTYKVNENDAVLDGYDLTVVTGYKGNIRADCRKYNIGSKIRQPVYPE